MDKRRVFCPRRLISRRFDVKVDAIKSLNGLASDMLAIGWVLRIPDYSTASAKKSRFLHGT